MQGWPLAGVEGKRHLGIVACVMAISTVYFALTLLIAADRPFWYDELFTYYVCHIGTLSDVWIALTNGIDSNPPLFYVFTRWMMAVIPNENIALRAPSLVGYWVMSLCVFGFVIRRSGFGPAVLAMVFPLTTLAYAYSYEARPYGVTLGAFGLTLLCWQLAADNWRRPFTLAGIALGMAVALLSHCYAVLFFFPLVGAELVRSLHSRRVDWPMWLMISMTTPLVLVYLPLMRATKGMVRNSWSPPSWNQPITFYEQLLQPALVPLAVIILLFALALILDRSRSGGATVPVHELAMALILLALPVLGVVVGKAATGIFTARYAIAAVIGMAVLLGFGVGCFRSTQRWVVAASVVTCLGWFALDYRGFARNGETRGGGTAENPADTLSQVLQKAEDNQSTIAVTDGVLFVELCFHAPKQLRSRLVYLSNREEALTFSGSDILEIGVPMLDRWFNLAMPTQLYEEFMRREEPFLAYGPQNSRWGWLPNRLARDGAVVTLKTKKGSNALLHVTPRHGKESAEALD